MIVPTRDRPDALRGCLEALASLEYPRELVDVIVVDDGGSSALVDVIAAFHDRMAVRLVHQPHGGPGAARNRAVEEARGELLVFTDDDCVPEPTWLRALVEGAGRDPTCAVGGRIVNALPQNPYSRASQLVLDLVYDHYNGNGHGARFFTSNNLAVPARGYRELGGFDPTLPTAEDRDLCDRWLGSGKRLIYVPGAVVHHHADLSFGDFVRKHFAYGRGAYRFQTGPAHERRRRAVAHFYASLPRTVTRSRKAAAADAGLLLVWQAANTAGFVTEAARDVRRRLRSPRQVAA